MRALVTGSTGKVGNAVARALARRGDDVRALARDPARAAKVLPDGVEPVQGDVGDASSLLHAADGCEVVFNSMGIPEQWLADERDFDRINALGSESVVRAAAQAGARRVVHTSTIDVFHAEPGAPFDESEVADYPKNTAYERSKQRAEELVLEAGRDCGIEVVIVNPAAVYGPGPTASISLDANLLAPVARGSRRDVPVLPPGGCGVAFSTGVAEGHLLAAARGEPGERYILCDTHATLRELAETTVRVAGQGIVPPVLPPPLARAVALGGEAVARIVRRPPVLPLGQLEFFLWNAAPQSGKAQRALGWQPTPLEDGIRATLAAMDPPLV